MIVVRVELHSAITGEISELARMIITNTGDGGKRRGNYAGATLIGRSTAALDRRTVSKIGKIENWPRLDKHVWNLVAAMLANMGYGR